MIHFISGLFLVIGAIFFFFVVSDIQTIIESDGNDYNFENIYEIGYEKSKIVVYRTDGGATVDFGIVVRKEKEILPGILYCHELFDQYHMDTVGIRLINDHSLEISDD